ncbi:GIY-YIG nuclease family protein [Marinilabiliaceae bacterium ANBcel2]|nr:GIY-YIG nuclease family protein [Marinilabiliaceae bacterium ANBcel2]
MIINSRQKDFESRCFLLDSEQIIKLNIAENQSCINNVIVGLEENFYYLNVLEDDGIIRYNLIFGSNKNRLSGFIVELNTCIKDSDRDNIVFMFANQISQEYEELNVIDVFNIYQRSIRSMYEKYNYFTYNPQNIKDKNTQLALKGKLGVIAVLEIEKAKFYQEFFNISKKSLSEDEEYVYLMYNFINDLIKIGQSKNPTFREKTLQSQEPEIQMIGFWKASKSIEKEFHKEFSFKRKRGEWFKLTFKDLKRIKNRMEKFE